MIRFTIRDLLLLTALAAMGIAWGVSGWHQSQQVTYHKQRAAYHRDRSAHWDWMYGDMEKGVSNWHPRYADPERNLPAWELTMIDEGAPRQEIEEEWNRRYGENNWGKSDARDRLKGVDFWGRE